MMDLEHALAQLETSQIIRHENAVESSYAFRHALTQEAVYESMLKSRRSELHRSVAQAIESVCAPELDQNAAVLALHYDRAGVQGKAFTYAALAGDVDARAYAHAEALLHYDQALAAANRSPELVPQVRVRQIYVSRGRVLEVKGDHHAAGENYQAMIDYAQRVGDLAMQADGLIHLLTTEGIIGEGAAGEPRLQEALALARRSGDQELVARALWNLGLSVRFRDLKQAEGYFRQALELARQLNLKELEAYALTDLCVEAFLSGRVRDCLDYAQQALAIFRPLGNQPMIVNALGMMAQAYLDHSDPSLAQAAAEEGLQISQMIENPWGIAYCEFSLQLLDMDRGDFDRSLVRGKRVVSVSSDNGIRLFEGISLFNVAKVYLSIGQVELARDAADRSAQALHPMKSRIWDSLVAGILALVHLGNNQLDQARAVLDPYTEDGSAPASLRAYYFLGPAAAAVDYAMNRFEHGLQWCDRLIERLEAEEVWTRLCEMVYWRGMIHQAMKNSDSALADLERAGELAKRGECRLVQWHVDAALARLYAAGGDFARAQEAQQRAGAFVSNAANNISNLAWRESFLNQPDARVMEIPYVETSHSGH